MCGKKKGKYKNADYGDPSYQGEPTDANLKDGPIEKRKCTDVICCIMFIAFCVFAVNIARTSVG
jgi:hypothetical protein